MVTYVVAYCRFNVLLQEFDDAPRTLFVEAEQDRVTVTALKLQEILRKHRDVAGTFYAEFQSRLTFHSPTSHRHNITNFTQIAASTGRIE